MKRAANDSPRTPKRRRRIFELSSTRKRLEERYTYAQTPKAILLSYWSLRNCTVVGQLVYDFVGEHNFVKDMVKTGERRNKLCGGENLYFVNSPTIGRAWMGSVKEFNVIEPIGDSEVQSPVSKAKKARVIQFLTQKSIELGINSTPWCSCSKDDLCICEFQNEMNDI